MNIMTNSLIHPLDVIANCKMTHIEDLDLQSCKHLTLWYYNPQNHSLDNIPNIPELETLRIYHSNITTLDNIERFQRLQVLDLQYLSKLENVDSISSLRYLDCLYIFSSKKIKNIENVLVSMPITDLKICDCGCLPSLNFITGIPNLKRFSFAGTKILDGDMTPLLSDCIHLSWCGFDNKKVYSHKSDEINKILVMRRFE